MAFTEPITPTLSLHNTKTMVGLSYLLGEKFFSPCLVHESEKKSEKNTFCLDCCISLCPHCLPPHKNHRLLQIRRYVYQDVIRLSDAQELMDCSLVQSYTTNSAKVVFLNQRPMTRPFKGGSANICIVCDRNLQHPYLFCSLFCKVHQMKIERGELKGVRIESCLDIERGQKTPDSVLELPISLRTSTRSSSSSVGAFNFARSTLASTAATEFVRKKCTTVTRHRAQRGPFPYSIRPSQNSDNSKMTVQESTMKCKEGKQALQPFRLSNEAGYERL